MDTAVKLVSQRYRQNAYGEEIEKETARSVYAEIDQIGRAEYFKAASLDLAPSFVAKTAAINYKGETILEHAGQRYAIYRTFVEDDTVELYCQREAGVSYAKN